MTFYAYFWKKFIFLIFLFSFFLVGCGAAEPVGLTSTTTPAQVSNQNNAYPGPDSAYPAIEIIDLSQVIAPVESDSPLELPDPSEGLATLGGIIINERTRRPPEESIVYLGNIVYTDTGLPIVQLDRQSAPLAILEENGEFIFRDITPAEYAVVFFTPEVSFPIDDAKSGETLLLTIQPNDKIDLGIVELPVR